MAINITGGQANGVVARITSSATSVFAVGEITIAYELGSNLKSWVPGRPINGFNTFVQGRSYYIQAIQSLDREAQFIPPIDFTTTTTSTTTTTTTTIITPPATGYRYATTTDVTQFPQMSIGDYIIDGPNAGQDIQARSSFGIQWYPYNGLGPGKKIWLKAGNYQNIYIDVPNCIGTANNKIIVSVYGGQLHYRDRWTINGNFDYLRITGEYDPDLGIGNANFQGHKAGYAFSRDKYLIVYDNQWNNISDSAPSAIAIDGGGKNLEVDHIEFRDGAFTSTFFNSANANVDFDGITVHDCYVHDMHGEGMYWGSTGSDPQRNMKNILFYNNRVLRVGNDGLQFGQLTDNNRIHNNVVALPALNYRDAFEQYQDNGTQLGLRKGGTRYDHNIIVGAGEKFLSVFYNPKTGVISNGDPLTIDNNCFTYCRGPLGAFFGEQNGGVQNAPIIIDSNYFSKFISQGYPQVYNDARGIPTDINIRMAIANNSVSLINNKYDTTKNTLIQNQANSIVTQSGNVQQTIPDIEFENFMGFPIGFNYLNLELWASVIGSQGGWVPDGSNKGQAVIYTQNMYVMHKSKLYRSKVNNNTGIEPGVTTNWQNSWAQIWWDINTGQQIESPTSLDFQTRTLTEYPPDDVRLKSDSIFNQANIGLIDNDPYTNISTSTTSTSSTSSTTTTTTTSSFSIDSPKIAVEDNGDNSLVLKWERNRQQFISSPVIIGIGSSTLSGTGAISPNKVGERIQSYLDVNTTGGLFVNVAQAQLDTRYFLADGGNALVMPHRNITAACSIRPTAILLFLPTNDIGAGLTPQQFVDNLSSMYQYAWDRRIPCFVGSPVPRTSFTPAQKNSLLQALAIMRNTFPSEFFIDLYDTFNDGNNNTLLQYEAGDGIHMNDAGHGVLAARFTQAFDDYFQDQAFTEYSIERSTSPNTGYTVFDTVTGGTNISTNYNRQDGSLYYYRVRSKYPNTTYTSYSNIVSLQQAVVVGNLEQTVQLDFSLNTTSAPPSGWNNLTATSVGPSQGQQYTSLVDSTNTATGISLTVSKIFSGAGGGGGTTWAQFTPRATEDNWFFNNTLSDPPLITISGLDNTKVYNIEIVSSRGTPDLKKFSGFISSNRNDGVQASLTPDVSNVTRLVTLRGVIADGSGSITLDCRAMGSTGYLNALILKRYANTGGTTSTTTTTTSSTTTTTTTAGSTTTTTTTTAAGSSSQINVNVYAGTNPYVNSQWNNWNVGVGSQSNVTFTNLLIANGSDSNINATLSGSTDVVDNGVNYGGTIFPPQVLRYTSYSTSTRTLTLSNLNNGSTYSIELVGSRSNTGNTTVYTIGGTSQNLVTDSNLTNSIIFNNISPTSNQIVITITRLTGSTYNYLNGFKIVVNGTVTTTSTTTTTTTTASPTTTTTTTSGPTTTTTSTTTIAGSSTYQVYGPYNGSQYMRVYLPNGYTGNSNDYPTYVFLHGAGERGSGNTTPGLNNTGLPQRLAAGQNHDMIIACPQLPSVANFWTTGTYLNDAMSFIKSNFRVDDNKFYVGGLSLGAFGAVDYAKANPTLVAYVDSVSGNPGTPLTSFQTVPITLWHGLSDSTQNAGNDTTAFTAINALSPDPVIPPRIHLFFGKGHNSSVWNTEVYDITTAKYRFDTRALLHSKVPEDQADNYVALAESTQEPHDYYLALKMTNSLSAGAPKTALLSRLSTLKSTIDAVLVKRYIINLGDTAAGNVNSVTSAEAGTTVSNIIDDTGASSAYGVQVVTKAITWTSAITTASGLGNEYYGIASDVWDNSFRVYQNGGRIKFTGLNNGKTYRLRFYTSWLDANSNEQAGVSIIIGSTVKYLSSQYQTNGWIDFDAISPTSNEIVIDWKALPVLNAGVTPTYNSTAGYNQVTTSQVASYNAWNGWMPAIVLYEKA